MFKSIRRDLNVDLSEAACHMKDKFVKSQDTYLNDYPLQNIWCFAGIGVVYSLPPEYSLARPHMSATGRYHNRLLFLNAVNAGASDRFPLFTIRSDRNPDQNVF